MKPTTLALGAFVLAIVFSVIFTLAAQSLSLLFSGLSTPFTMGSAVLSTLVATAIINTVFKQAVRRFRWRMIWIEVALLAFVSVGILSWTNTRQHLRIFMKPMAVPDSVHVKHGRQILFSNFVHFTASQSDIAALIQSKGLIEVPEWDPDGDAEMPENYSARARAKTAWGWWQPASIPGARFYYRHHKSLAPQGWSEGWWVNHTTNEVFAYISG